jgi:glycosyltransferase involved in cell wall biosynthesis
MEPRVALVHDTLIQDGGGERVLAALQELFPRAPTFTLFYDPERAHTCFVGKDIRASGLQHIPFFRRHEAWLLPFMPMAVEQFDFSGFDLVISSCSSFAKGIIVPPGTRHVCYLHTPTRFLWEDRASYVSELPQPLIIKRLLPFMLHRLRVWDRLAADRPDVIMTNSETSRERIRRYYGRAAHVISPPVDLPPPTQDPASMLFAMNVPSVLFAMNVPSVRTEPGRYWLTGGRLVGYKRFDLTVRAFAKLNLPLKIFGVGPELKRLRRLAGAQTQFLGRVTDAEKTTLYQNAVGFLHPHIEDFGITALEAMAAGKPVIAYGKGGGAETVKDGVTGQFIEAQTWEDIGDAIIRFNPAHFDAAAIRAHAAQFAKDRFKEQFRTFLETSYASHPV